jgi:hypothetical protein
LEQAGSGQSNNPHLRLAVVSIVALVVIAALRAAASTSAPEQVASGLVPVFSKPAGYYDQDVRLEITAPRNGDRVIFTTDGSTPTLESSTVYTQPLLLSTQVPAVTVVRARAVSGSQDVGLTATASYFLGVQAQLPLVSLAVAPDDLWDTDRGIYANSQMRGADWERPASVTFVDVDRTSGFSLDIGLRMHGGAWGRGKDKKSFRLYFRNEYGTSRLEYRLFDGSNVNSFKRLVLHAGGQDWSDPPLVNWTLLRSRLADTLALETDAYATRGRAVLLFINGAPWGIYQMRERIDEHFFEDRYHITAADHLIGPEYAERAEIRSGDRENWDALMNFVESHDLSAAEDYGFVSSQIDTDNFIDYCLLQIYSVNTDWPLNNVHQVRPRVPGGRWHWVVWDTDHGFGLNLFSHYTGDMMEYVLHSNNPNTGGRDLTLLRALLDNSDFRSRFVGRAAELLNSTLSPQSVISQVDALADEISHDIAYEAVRWSSVTNWEANVEDLRVFARKRPDVMRSNIVKVFGLGGTAQITITAALKGSGYVAVGDTLIQQSPWTGIFFEGQPLKIVAVPAPGYQFAGWDPATLVQEPTMTPTEFPTQTIVPRFERVDDDTPSAGDAVFVVGPHSVNDPVKGTAVEFRVAKPSGLNLCAWRLTDNDEKTLTDEGSLIFPDHPAFRQVPFGTVVRVVDTASSDRLPEDDLDTWDRDMVLYLENGTLDNETDPGFALGPHEAVVLLAPGQSETLGDDIGITMWHSSSVDPASFGVLQDGVLPINN